MFCPGLDWTRAGSSVEVVRQLGWLCCSLLPELWRSADTLSQLCSPAPSCPSPRLRPPSYWWKGRKSCESLGQSGLGSVCGPSCHSERRARSLESQQSGGCRESFHHQNIIGDSAGHCLQTSKLDIFSSMLRLLQLQVKTFYNSVKIRIACVARKSMLSVVLVVLRGFSLSPGFPRTG